MAWGMGNETLDGERQGEGGERNGDEGWGCGRHHHRGPGPYRTRMEG